MAAFVFGMSEFLDFYFWMKFEASSVRVLRRTRAYVEVRAREAPQQSRWDDL
ncbi:MAG: hypothetical protein RIQ41_462 [Candidatus Parcubacteria bacterium]|jgi:hypothetical protein